MTGQLQRAWNFAEVRSLLRASEARRSPVRPTAGHAGEVHVDITRDGMREHADRPHGEIELATAFLCFDDQVNAAVALLNHAEGQAALGHLDGGRGNRRVTIEATMPLTQVRCATQERNWTQPMDAARMVLDCGSHGFGLHIHTLFPILMFSRDRPSWRMS